ncbi:MULTISPECIES: class I SAM-dependent methyltransferase [Nocardioides]|uniref:Class I SAM-dependent methyltransferase n=1 Tax=Nocardioides vastitatis TaxID=2568655 RepID=A0ABW0ZM22_9ACTN|nr:class I SAM-dependent methyltransferase [Nocardioides sp.]THI98453.1 methyltransferase domain-containing protein [Nocardioides sp.]
MDHLGARIATWDAEAASFDEPADHGLSDPAIRETWLRLMLDTLPPAPARVVDLGCGTGTLTLLLAEAGYAVDGLDFSPAMVARARAKLAGVEGATVAEGDAAEPRLPLASYDVVLSRHVLWAMLDPTTALARWSALLRPRGRVVLVEGCWSSGVGLTAARTVALAEGAGLRAEVRPLDDPAYWGRPISDERYLVVAVPAR